MSLLPEISQASTEINKLVAQANIHQTIAPVDPAAFTDPADTALLASRDPVIREVSVGMTGEAYSDYSVSGTPPLSLSNSLGKPLKAWSVDLLPYQEGTGDPAPDNVRPIHGTDKLTITTAGENLFDGRIEQGNFNQSGLNIHDNTRLRTIGFIPVMAGSTITVTYVGAKFTGFAVSGYVDADYTINRTQSTNWLANGTSVTIDSNIRYVRINFRAASGLTDVQPSDISDVMVNFGNTALPFTPYLAPSQTAITLPSTVYNGTVGSDGGESRTAAVDMGDLDWIYHSGQNAFYYITPDGKPTGTGRSNYGMCEAYKVMIGTLYANLTDGQMAVGTNFSSAQTASVVVKDSRFTDAAQFKAAVSGVKLVYEIADPTTFAVPSVTIPTPTGTATTWATAEDGTMDSMEVTYIKSE